MTIYCLMGEGGGVFQTLLQGPRLDQSHAERTAGWGVCMQAADFLKDSVTVAAASRSFLLALMRGGAGVAASAQPSEEELARAAQVRCFPCSAIAPCGKSMVDPLQDWTSMLRY